jgi:thiamine biosynthesis lipoprotein
VKITRRKLLIAATAAGAAGLAGGSRSQSPVFVWRGNVMGADAGIMIHGHDRHEAQRIATMAAAEARRVEAAFSLYRPDSELSRLNSEGMLANPSHDFRVLLTHAVTAHGKTEGAFNVAIQPWWRALARAVAETGRPPVDVERQRLLALADPSRITISAARIELAPEMALTFNGIAQGYATDRAAELLGSEGLSDILVDLGETRALPGRAWTLATEGGRRIDLARRAFACSRGGATPFGADPHFNHLVDPATGACASPRLSVTVTAATATEADLLSTALTLLPPERRRAVLERFSGAAAFYEDVL